MTREQARREIDSLDFYLRNHTDDYGEESHTAMMMAIKALSSSEKPNKWIPITSRPMTEEEKEDFAERTGYDEKDFDDILSCPLPEDGETVLITDRLGNVEVDTFINDCDGCYFECNCDMEDVKAWMPLPEPYKAEGSEE